MEDLNLYKNLDLSKRLHRKDKIDTEDDEADSVKQRRGVQLEISKVM